MYAVEHTFTGALFALKLMRAHLGASADAIQRFQREARAASKIRSQHVVRVFDADIAPEFGGAPYLVMDLLEGSDLEQISHGKPVAPEEVIEWLRQVAVALDRAHRIGIIHRDLKPENLFLTRLDDGTPVVKILDFGIARISAESPGTTQAGQIFGTPQYMAPEQARGEPEQMGPATDLFGLGQIAYCLLTGTSYRTENNLGDILNEILNKPLQPPSEKGCLLGPGFDAWFLQACHAEPAQRFPSARDQVEALAGALGLPVESKVPDSGDGRQSPIPSSLGSQPMRFPSLRVDSGAEALRRSPTVVRGTDTAISAKGVALPTTTLSPDPDEIALRRRSRRPAALLIALLVFLPLLAFAFIERHGSAVAPAARASACPVESGITSIAVADLPRAPALVPDVGDAPKPAAVAVRTTSSEREPGVRAPPVTRAASTRIATARRSPIDDDPLSDQQ